MPKKILIVDDERLITETLSGLLKLKGYEVMEALDGETALMLLKQTIPDLVLLDMKLPGIDGLEVLKVLRANYPAVFVIVMTGYDVSYKQKVDAIGADGFFVKPVMVNDIKEKIIELFNKPKPKEATLKESEVPLSEASHSLPETVSPDPDTIIPKAKILLIEPREMLVNLLEDYFSRKELCLAEYEIRWTSLSESLGHTDFLKHFQPDIILFDVALVGLYGEFATTLMNLPQPPKEIILFGDPAAKWDETDSLIKRGMLYIPTPLDTQYQLPHKDILDKLNVSLKKACIKHKLFRLKEEKEK